MASNDVLNICELAKAHGDLKEVNSHLETNCAGFSCTCHASIKSQEDFATVSTNVLTLVQINISSNEIIEDEAACLST